jgi:hypothetical protein
MEAKRSEPRTLREAIVYFSNPDRCHEFMMALRWPDGVVCPTCGDKEPQFIASRSIWQCRNKHANRQFSVKKNSVMEDSPIGLDKWLPAFWLLTNCKNGISSYELARDLKVTQKTAWFMLQRIRLAMQRGTFDKPMGTSGGPVEADETFIGGLARNMHKSRRAKAIKGTGGAGKSIVMGLLDRETRKVRVKHVPNTQRETLHGEIHKHVAPGAEIHTDEWVGYKGLDPEYVHQFVNHAENYVCGNVHTNGLENFWSLLARMIKGTYVSVEPFHLFRYLDEEAFRFNERKDEDGDRGRFEQVVAGAFGKRLMYKELIGAAPVGITT